MVDVAGVNDVETAMTVDNAPAFSGGAGTQLKQLFERKNLAMAWHPCRLHCVRVEIAQPRKGYRPLDTAGIRKLEIQDMRLENRDATAFRLCLGSVVAAFHGVF